jgi:hypothetical protein
MAETSKSWTFDKAPKKITLHGDKTKKVESSQHIIEFPGGAIEVTRTQDGEYWAHIMVNTGDACGEGQGFDRTNAEITDTRIDFLDPAIGVCSIQPSDKPFNHIAVRIRPIK